MRYHLLSLVLVMTPLAACDDGETDDPGPGGAITFDAPAMQEIEVGGTADYTITGLDDDQAYRITLVVDANLTPGGDGTATFIDGDMNGAADAGPSETIGLITMVNGEMVAGAKTVPAGTDDPADPSGIFPAGGQITITVSGVGAGTVYPVAYHNGGASTFLEIDETGSPIETYAVGGSTTVAAGQAGPIMPMPANDSPIGIGGTVDYTIDGLSDTQAYRITLVVGPNIGVEAGGTASFVDNDVNGAADAGPSETVALITTVNGMPVADGGAKTVPGGMDDPANPSGIFPTGGQITLTVTGVGSGRVYPVVYHNGGESTFLEIDNAGRPVENYGVGGSVTVRGPTPMVAPADPQTIAVDGTVDYTLSGLADGQAYRITLVVGDNITASGASGTFVDGDMNGAADAGPSEMVALITTVNGMMVDAGGAKTVPGGTDDPAMPSGIFPMNGSISLTITGVGAGTVYPVAYENGGMSTFLEIEPGGSPREVYAVGGSITVE